MALIEALDPLYFPLKRSFQHCQAVLSLHRTQATDAFRRKVAIEADVGQYRISTARNGDEVEKALKLRYRVFHHEYGTPASPFRLDVDRYDFECDHLLITDRTTGEVVGTYRILFSELCSAFYSESEFHLEAIRALPGTKLELGRACIDPRHRQGAVIRLLWKGLLLYRNATGARYLFGCSSIRTEDPQEIQKICGYLVASGAMRLRPEIKPRPGYEVAGARRYDLRLEAGEADRIQAMIPPLLNSYLKAGAEIWGEPALDREFHCIDLLTVLDMERMNPAFRRMET